MVYAPDGRAVDIGTRRTLLALITYCASIFATSLRLDGVLTRAVAFVLDEMSNNIGSWVGFSLLDA